MRVVLDTNIVASAAVLACAVAAGANAIVSGDGDLHVLGDYRGIPVLNAAQTLQRIGA